MDFKKSVFCHIHSKLSIDVYELKKKNFLFHKMHGNVLLTRLTLKRINRFASKLNKNLFTCCLIKLNLHCRLFINHLYQFRQLVH